MSVKLPEFDVLVSIAQQDPEAFENFRRRLLREAVDEAPPEHRESLEQLLVRIEDARSEATSPAEAAGIAFRMMTDSVAQLQDGWEQALDAMAGLQTALLLERLRRASAAPGKNL